VYVLVREDLSPSQQVVQSCHAAIEAARTFLPPEHEHPHLVICGVRDEPALWARLHRLQERGVHFRPFFEPDLGGQLTALATEPLSGDDRRLFRSLRLLTTSPKEARS
jgi:hypothetical protein